MKQAFHNAQLKKWQECFEKAGKSLATKTYAQVLQYFCKQEKMPRIKRLKTLLVSAMRIVLGMRAISMNILQIHKVYNIKKLSIQWVYGLIETHPPSNLERQDAIHHKRPLYILLVMFYGTYAFGTNENCFSSNRTFGFGLQFFHPHHHLKYNHNLYIT